MKNRVSFIEITPQNVLTENCASSEGEYDKHIAALRSTSDLKVLSSITVILGEFL